MTIQTDQNFAMESSPVGFLSDATGLPIDLVKTVLLMILSTPLCAVFRIISQPNLRYAYSLFLGVAYLGFLVHQWVFYILAVAIVPFVAFNILQKKQYTLAVIISIGFLLFIHVYRFIYDYMSWKIDCSVPVMYLVTKVVYYGHFLQHHKQKSSFFKYMSYCFFFPSVLIGPTFSYTTFQNFIQKKNGYESPQLKSNLLLKQVAKTIFFTIGTVLVMPTFTPYWSITDPWFKSLSPLSKFLLLNVIGVFYRIKFYSAWGFTQLAVDFSGLSWNHKEQSYNSVRCGSSRFQTQLNPRNKTNYWNSSVQVWLKQMIFDKTLSKTKSSLVATFVTFFSSALWHGIYLSYYVGFIQWAIVITISKWGYRMSHAYPKLANFLPVKIVAWIVSSSMLNYVGMFIVVLTWDQAVQSYRDMWFIGNILMVILLIASQVIKPPRHKHAKGKHQGDEGHEGHENKKKDSSTQNIEKQRTE